MRSAVRLSILPLAAGSLALATLAPAHAAQEGKDAIGKTALAKPADGFWTAARMRQAEAHPRDMPARAYGPQARKPVPPITKATVATGHGKAPAKMIGRLYIEGNDGGVYTCTGTVINSAFPKKGKGNQSVMLTAGHCVTDPDEGFESRTITFFPDYSDGNARKGVWSGQWVFTYNSWSVRAEPQSDYAMIAMARHSNGPIQKFTGGQSLLTKVKGKRLWVRAYGYAGSHAPNDTEYPDRGDKLRMCKGDFKRRTFGANKEFGLRCDLSHGASGGPLIAKFASSGYGRVISVLSFRLKRDDGYLYAPVFGAATHRMFLAVRKEKTDVRNMDGVGVPF
ncbi:peptidase [Actinocorallia lasiicapitis]